MKKLFILILPLVLCRCSTMVKSISLGAGIGVASGFTTSRFAEYNTKGTVVLTVSGLLIGGALAALLHKDPPPELSQIPLLNGKPPSLKDADTDMIFVPDLVQDGKYVEGHRIWTIRSPAYWQLEPAKPEKGEEDSSKGTEQKPEKVKNSEK